MTLVLLSSPQTAPLRIMVVKGHEKLCFIPNYSIPPCNSITHLLLLPCDLSLAIGGGEL